MCRSSTTLTAGPSPDQAPATARADALLGVSRKAPAASSAPVRASPEVFSATGGSGGVKWNTAPATQSEGRCHHVSRLLRKVKVNNLCVSDFVRTSCVWTTCVWTSCV